MGYTQKIVKKSAYWHRHGKHQPVDPTILRQLYPDRAPRPAQWYSSLSELFGRRI